MDGVIYVEGGDQHIWMVTPPGGNLLPKAIRHSSPSLQIYHNVTAVMDGF